MGSDEALTAQQIEHYRTLLVEERTAAEARMKERGLEVPPTVRQDDDDPGDYADDAAALAERERLLNESEFDGELVEKIDHALDRLREGTYGVSEVSGARIPVERLEAVPWATTLPGEEPTDDE
jgi:RNA polymerase-binding transcription factor DksA